MKTRQSKLGDLARAIEPLLALLNILGGVQALGPIGILIGPMIVAFLQTLLKILHRELTALNQEEGEANGEEEAVGDDPT